MDAYHVLLLMFIIDFYVIIKKTLKMHELIGWKLFLQIRDWPLNFITIFHKVCIFQILMHLL